VRPRPGGIADWVPGEPRHHDWYPGLWTEAGFSIAGNYSSNWLYEPEAISARFGVKAALSLSRGNRVRPLAAADLPALFQIAMIGFADAFMYTPIEPAEFALLYGSARVSAAAGSSYVAVDGADRTLGFIYTFDTVLDGEPASIWKTVAVLPDARDSGVYHHLVHTYLREGLERGQRRFLATLMHIDGTPAHMGWARPDTVVREYALFERGL
jgi:hypothetical protein